MTPTPIARWFVLEVVRPFTLAPGPNLDTAIILPYPCAYEHSVCASMKPNLKSEMKTSVQALINDLSAVRAAVLHEQRVVGVGERTTFEARLFESWVIDKLAQHECQVSAVSEEMAALREEFAALRKSLQPPAKKVQKEKKKA
jgi:hypothetical protein